MTRPTRQPIALVWKFLRCAWCDAKWTVLETHTNRCPWCGSPFSILLDCRPEPPPTIEITDPPPLDEFIHAIDQWEIE